MKIMKIMKIMNSAFIVDLFGYRLKQQMCVLLRFLIVFLLLFRH